MFIEDVQQEKDRRNPAHDTNQSDTKPKLLECDREVNDYFIKWLVDYDRSRNGQVASNLDRVF